ncbi:hypothetical protein ACJ41P_32325 [Azospirillum argentinense]|uniref:Tyr recombinase domain-containing protein n=1 Tax=Azospirillum argentinense TaxID=2970906 RepID=A0ABW8VHL4_9PROT
MLENKIESISDLNEDWFALYCEGVQQGGIRYLLGLDRRVQDLVARVLSGEALPTYAGLSNVPRLQTDHVAASLGLPDAISIPRDLRAVIGNVAKEVAGINLLDLQAAWHDVPEKRTERPLSAAGIRGYLLPWDCLSRLREYIPGTLGVIKFQAFNHKTTVGGLACQLAVRGDHSSSRGRTASVPPFQACFLIDRALRWVLSYAEDLRKLMSVTEDLHRRFPDVPGSDRGDCFRTRRYEARKMMFPDLTVGPDAPGAPWPLDFAVHKRSSSTGYMLTVARAVFVLLPTACLIVIAAFTARRSGEIDSLQVGCVNEDADGELWLSTWIEKALRDVTRIPIPASVQRAVNVLEWLSADARERSGTRWLFQFFGLQHRVSLTALTFRNALKEFASYVGVPPLPDGSPWVFSPHQFRRFFSICYYWRWSFGSLTALSAFLRQFDLEVTRRYVTEASRGELARLKEDASADRAVRAAAAQELSGLAARRRAHRDVSREHRTIIAQDVVAGRTALGGFGGEQITKQLEHLIIEFERRLEIRPVSSPQGLLNELLSGFVAHTLTHLEPNPLGHSLCKCSRAQPDLAAARCLDEFQATHPDTPRPGQPDHAHASDTVCGGCPHNVLPRETEPYWIEAIAKAGGVAASTPAAHLRTVATKRATALRAIHKRGFQDAKRIARPITLEEPNADDA